MALIYQEKNYAMPTNPVKNTETTSDRSRENTDESKAINQFLLKPNHELTVSGTHYSQKQSIKTQKSFNSTCLKNPDPSSAFFFVIMISVGTILLPFIPVAANYFSKVIEPFHENNHHNQLIHHITS